MKRRPKRKYSNNINISRLPRTINCFCLAVTVQHELFFSKGLDFYSNLDPHDLADEFVSFFELKYPLTFKQLFDICRRSNIYVNFLPGKHKARGYNFSYGRSTSIHIRNNDSPSGKIHTLLHELYEIIDDRLFVIGSTYGRKFDKYILEQRADRFAACAHVPGREILRWIHEKGLDIFGLEKYCNSSYATALVRLNEYLQRFTILYDRVEPLPMIGILYERPYWKKTPSGRLPKMRLTCFTNSDKDTFNLEKEDIEKVSFFEKRTKAEIELAYLVKVFSQEGLDTFFHDKIMFMRQPEDKKLKILGRMDILVRVVEWNKYHYPMKVLVQIMPYHRPYLARVADSLKIVSSDKILDEKEKMDACRTLRKGIVRKTG